MPEKSSTHAGFIKAISPWLPDSTGREGLYSCRTDSGWSSVLVSPVCCSGVAWIRAECAWMVGGTSVSSQEANNSFSSEERVGEVCVSFDIIRSERIWKRTLEWQPRRAQSQAQKTDRWYFMAMSEHLGCFWNFSFSRGWFVLLRLITPHPPLPL